MATLDELRESLSSPAVAALIAKRISPMLLDYVRKEDAFETAFPVQDWDTDTYFWNTVDRFPMPQASTEAPPTSGTGSVSPTQSNYRQSSFQMKHYQVNGDISKYADKIARVSVTGLLQTEMMRTAKSMRWFRSILLAYGDDVATTGTYRPQWAGFDRQIGNQNRIVGKNGVGGTLDLNDLDDLYDSVRTKLAAPLQGPDFFYAMSPLMYSQVARLHVAGERFVKPIELSARRRDISGLPVPQVAGGLEVPSYRGIPIVETSFLSPNGSVAAPTLAAGGTGGTIPAAAQYYQVDAITQYGPTYTTAAASVTPTAGQNVTLTITTPNVTDVFGTGLPILQYRIYKGSSATNCSLYGVVSAVDAADNAVTSIQDTGSSLIANPGANQIPGRLLVTGSGTGAGYDFPVVTPANSLASAESVYLVCRDPDFVTVPTVTDLYAEVLAPVNIRTVQYAMIGDACFAMRAPLFGAKLEPAATR